MLVYDLQFVTLKLNTLLMNMQSFLKNCVMSGKVTSKQLMRVRMQNKSKLEETD